MKIKLFENFDKLYHQIEVDEYEEFAGDDNIAGKNLWMGPKKLDGFTKIEIEKLKSLFGQGLTGNHNIEINKWVNFCDKNCNGMVSSLKIHHDFAIRKLYDEWYYVYDEKNYKFYKCDTFDGLIQCLETI